VGVFTQTINNLLDSSQQLELKIYRALGMPFEEVEQVRDQMSHIF